MRTIGATILAAALLAPSAFAATQSASPLPSGQAAGTTKAALLRGPGFIWLGLGILAGGLAMTISGGNKNGVSTTTTTGTGA